MTRRTCPRAPPKSPGAPAPSCSAASGSRWLRPYSSSPPEKIPIQFLELVIHRRSVFRRPFDGSLENKSRDWIEVIGNRDEPQAARFDWDTPATGRLDRGL